MAQSYTVKFSNGQSVVFQGDHPPTNNDIQQVVQKMQGGQSQNTQVQNQMQNEQTPSLAQQIGTKGLNYLGLNVGTGETTGQGGEQGENAAQMGQQDIFGIGSLLQSPGRSVYSYYQEQSAQMMDASRDDLAQVNLQLARKMNSIQDPAQRIALRQQVIANYQQMQSMSDQADKIRASQQTQGNIWGSALKAAGTAVLGMGTGIEGVLGKIATGAAAGAPFGLGQALTQGENDPKALAIDTVLSSLTMAAMNPSVDYAAKLGKTIIDKSGNIIAKNLYKLALPTFGKLDDTPATSDGLQQLIDKGIWGKATTILSAIGKGMNDTGEKISSILSDYSSSDGAKTLNPLDIFNKAKERLDTITNHTLTDTELNTSILGNKAKSLWGTDVQEVMSSGRNASLNMAKQLLSSSKEVSMAAANGVKSALDNLSYAGKGMTAQSKLAAKSASAIADTLRAEITSTVPGIEEAFSDYSNFANAKEKVMATSGGGKTALSILRNILPFAGAIFGGYQGSQQGGVTGAIGEGMGGLLLGGLLSTTGETGGGILADRIATFVGSLAEKGGMISKPALLYGLSHLITDQNMNSYSADESSQ
jgi:hypothetical protein